MRTIPRPASAVISAWTRSVRAASPNGWSVTPGTATTSRLMAPVLTAAVNASAMFGGGGSASPSGTRTGDAKYWSSM